MQATNNRDFKELIENIYRKKFGNNSSKKIDKIEVSPIFFYNEITNTIRIELKEFNENKDNSDIYNFYNKLQNINEHKTKEAILQINGNEKIYRDLLNQYIDLLHFENKPNTKYLTKKYYKEKILVELQAMESIIEYSINNEFKIYLNGEEVKYQNKELSLNFELKNSKNEFYIVLKENINDFKYIIRSTNNTYIFYKDGLYKCSKDFIKKEYEVLKIFLKNYKNEIYLEEKDITNFFSLVYPNIKNNLKISDSLYKKIEKCIPQKLIIKLFLDFDNRNYLIADLKFCYENIEFNPIITNKLINVNRNLLEENIFLDKLVKTGFMLDNKNKRFIITNDESIFNFMNSELESYYQCAQLYVTDRFSKRKIKNGTRTSLSVHVNNNLLEIDFSKLPINKDEMKDVLEKYKLKQKFYRLKDGSFIILEDNQNIKVLNDLLDGIDVNYKKLDSKIVLPINRAMYIEKLLEEHKEIKVETDLEYKKITNDINNFNNKSVPQNLENVLRDYQKVGYNWLKILDHYKFGGILADDMGLGKTIQILAMLIDNKEKNEQNAASIVVAPSSLTLNWKNEAEKFAPCLKILLINGNAEERKEKIKEIKNYDLVLTSYDLLKRDIEEYEKCNYTFRFIIADEAQYIKNNSTQNSKAIKRINAQTRFALTGTPIENSLSELWSIFDFIMPGYLFTYKKFKKEYEIPITRDKNEDVLIKLKMIIEPFILRRTKKEVLKELPDKSTIVINNEMVEEQEKIYLSYLAEARDEVYEEIESRGFEQSRIKILSLLTRLRQICCHPSLFIDNYYSGSGKLNQCIELIKTGISSGHKILLFSGYTSMFKIIEKELNKENVNYIKLTGKTNIKDRFELIDKFNSDENIKVFLISLKAGGTGINLTAADMVIHYDPWWNLSVENQATDRTHRIGQTKKVQVYKLITKNSIEEKIYDLQQRKKELIDNMLSTDTKFLNKLSKEDILKLFE